MITLSTDRKTHEFPVEFANILVGRNVSKVLAPGHSYFRVSGLSVSRIHCEIEYTGACYIVRDLGSSNGTRVNGKKVDKQILNDGDVINAGVVPIFVSIGKH